MTTQLTRPDQPIAHAALNTMRRSKEENPTWEFYAYENHDLGHPLVGHMQFLACGPDNTHKTPPSRMPDTDTSLGWRYVFVGKVNLETGLVEPQDPPREVPAGMPPAPTTPTTPTTPNAF
jgi:hypothetical protein